MNTQVGFLFLASCLFFHTEGLGLPPSISGARPTLPPLPTLPPVTRPPLPTLPPVTLPTLPPLPVTLPPLPTLPTLPPVTLPPLPSLPTLPPLPVTLPPLPNLPTLPPVSLPPFKLSPVKLPSIKLPKLPYSLLSLPGLDKVNVGQATCSFKGTSGSCCLTVSIKETEKSFDNCLSFTLNAGKINIALSVNGKQLIQKDIDSKLSNLCYPIPSTPLKACLNIYHFEANPKEKTATACTKVTLQPTVSNTELVDVNFGCVKYANGELEMNSDFTPDNKGLVNVNLIKGQKPSVSLGDVSSVIKSIKQ